MTGVDCSRPASAAVALRDQRPVPGYNVAWSTALATIATSVYLGYLVGPLIIGPIANATSLRLALVGVGILFLSDPALARVGQTSSRATATAAA